MPSEVVFDEVHFGTFANHYIHGRFFFDVHPPLAKILIALAGRVAGYNGNFDFGAIGNDYLKGGDRVPYVEMRACGAALATLLIPIAYFTLRYGGHSRYASIFAAAALCYENSLVTNSRFILLDSYLLFFTALTVLSWNKFFRERQRPFRPAWWIWLLMTGINLGLTVSCKWVGLFTIATIGLSTVHDLWSLLGDLRVSTRVYFAHFVARGFCLIVVPIMIYIGIFGIHFAMLPLAGEGDTHMSAQFQHSLVGHEIPDSPMDIAYGSKVTIRHVATNGGYLHSHPAAYPDGSKLAKRYQSLMMMITEQQVTLYPYRDDNNWWIIRKMNSTLDGKNDDGRAGTLGKDGETWIDYVRHGDTIRLEHVATSPRKLHSHDEHAPLTDVEYHKEVSAYGFPDFDGDANDFWRVELLDERDPDNRLKTLRTRFQLIHPLQACALFSHEIQLPEWGFGQQEVTCIQGGKKPKTLWMVEETRNDLLPGDVKMVNYETPSFWAKFVELHKVMWKANKGLTQSHPYESRPSSWPMLRSGISYWANHGRHIYFLGNPVVYWMSTIAVFNFMILWGFFQVREKLGYRDHYGGLRNFFERSAGFYVMGWALHYVPFYIMGRQLFLHHYLPGLYFAVLMLAVGIDLALLKARPNRRLLFVIMVVTGIIMVYRMFAPLTYGTEWTREACEQQQWLPTWQFSCERLSEHASNKHNKTVKECFPGKREGGKESVADLAA
ncbi:Dolichyl-phosphate-mannose-protein mannosyltransferase-domain-containing protein [Dichotomocladium elegans]|nr:Dolichyl-phosphate-mannose-protein mannosyltransferase-domain-containing protein [Dichotomocladium elegans]